MSSDTTYSVKYAPSGRAKCRFCTQKIEKDTLIVRTTFSTGNNYDMTQSYHPACFNMPNEYAGTVDDFVDNELVDASDDKSILPKERDTLVQAISIDRKKTKRAPVINDDSNPASADAIISKIKQDAEDEPPSKKAKTEDAYNSSDFVPAYRSYEKDNNEGLKEILRYNRQYVTGKKSYLLLKVLDGHVRGRLARCQLCQGGKLKIDEKDCTKVTCNGKFDEDTQQRYPCAFEGKITDAPRWKPWFTEEPSEKEMEDMDKMEREMDKLDAAASGKAIGDDTNEMAMIKADADRLEWNLQNKAGIRAATSEAVALLRKYDAKLPDDDGKAKQKVGPLLVAHKNGTPGDIILGLLKDVGRVISAEAQAEKDKAVESVTKVPENADLVAAFKELSELYSKEGNRNAALTYSKVVAAVAGLDYEATAENAMKMCKGKTKVPGIGEATAKKIKEFCEKGTLDKLEEKRADAA